MLKNRPGNSTKTKAMVQVMSWETPSLFSKALALQPMRAKIIMPAKIKLQLTDEPFPPRSYPNFAISPYRPPPTTQKRLIAIALRARFATETAPLLDDAFIFSLPAGDNHNVYKPAS